MPFVLQGGSLESLYSGRGPRYTAAPLHLYTCTVSWRPEDKISGLCQVPTTPESTTASTGYQPSCWVNPPDANVPRSRMVCRDKRTGLW
jgi:hypothetical protein